VKAITVRQPWAWAIAQGHKLVENRTWTTRHRGQLAIHAGSRWDGPAAHLTVARFSGCHVGDVRVTDTHMGAVIAVVELVDICTATLAPDGACDCGPWAMDGHAHWRLANPRALEVPIPFKGRQGLWDLTSADKSTPSALDREVLAQLREVAS